MVFSSHLFCFVFLPCALGLYFLAPRRGRNLALTLLSYVFYGWSNPAFVPLMLTSTVIDYIAGRVIDAAGSVDGRRPGRARWALAASIATNLGLLGFFKYFHFGLDSWNAAAAQLGFAPVDSVLRVVLPLGISFYTFQSMSYTIDVYRGEARALRNPIDFACFVAMFPQLVAGPIVRFQEIDGQLVERRETLGKAARGAAFFSLGLAKKVLLANPCGQIADAAFDAAARTTLDAWLGVLAYAFQIYFDFSGYSDMAVGLGLLFGFSLPRNFDAPYASRSVTEFWRRWHQSLSRWLRDYLYIPLGGNRRGELRTYLNLLLVMLLGGLWHGAAWTFVVWGALHGLALAVERAVGVGRTAAMTGWGALPARAAVFLFILLTWVPFRAADLGAALAYFADLFALREPAATAALVGGLALRPYLLATLAAAAVVCWAAPQPWTWTRRLTAGKAAAVVVLFALTLGMLETQGFNPFIYFIF
ncbi:MAG: MBOAT family O-acyltransferase [Acidobacteriota bacterium]